MKFVFSLNAVPQIVADGGEPWAQRVGDRGPAKGFHEKVTVVTISPIDGREAGTFELDGDAATIVHTCETIILMIAACAEDHVKRGVLDPSWRDIK